MITLYVRNVFSNTDVLMAFANPSCVTMPKTFSSSTIGTRLIMLSLIMLSACLTVAFEERVTMGEDIIDFNKVLSESAPLITTLSKISLSVTTPMGFSDLETIIVSAFFAWISLTALATSTFSSITEN